MPNYRGDITDLRVVRRVEQHPQAWRVWQPVIIPGQKKRHLIVAFGAMVNGKKDMGDILATRSTDDGDTWEEPVMIFDHRQRQGMVQFAYANPVLYRAPGQDVIWCFAMRCPIAQKNSEESQLVGAFTADGGYSWTPVEMAMHYAGAAHHMLNHRNYGDRLSTQISDAGPPQHTAGRPHAVRVTTSFSAAPACWNGSSKPISPNPPMPVFSSMRGISRREKHQRNCGLSCELPIMTTPALRRTPPRAYSSVSRDGGRTWRVAKPEPDLHNAKSKAFFGRSSNGTHIYVYSDGPPQGVKTPEFPNGGRISLRYKTKNPGDTWSEEKTFYDAGIKNSYPTLIEIAPGDFRCVWDSGTPDTPRTHIQFGKLRISP